MRRDVCFRAHEEEARLARDLVVTYAPPVRRQPPQHDASERQPLGTRAELAEAHGLPLGHRVPSLRRSAALAAGRLAAAPREVEERAPGIWHELTCHASPRGRVAGQSMQAATCIVEVEARRRRGEADTAVACQEPARAALHPAARGPDTATAVCSARGGAAQRHGHSGACEEQERRCAAVHA